MNRVIWYRAKNPVEWMRRNFDWENNWWVFIWIGLSLSLWTLLLIGIWPKEGGK